MSDKTRWFLRPIRGNGDGLELTRFQPSEEFKALYEVGAFPKVIRREPEKENAHGTTQNDATG